MSKALATVFGLGMALAAIAIAGPAMAHEVHGRWQLSPVSVLTLTYANGQPFAYESFEVRPLGSSVPSQVGRTDAAGRAAILPVGGNALEVVASARDGHGARVGVPAPSGDPELAECALPAANVPRWMQLLTGFGVLFGLFGILQLFLNANKKT